jgi:hypothetical protein
MSNGSMDATATSGNGSRTTSPACSCGSQRSAFEVKPLGRRIVHSRPDSRTAFSDRICPRSTALVRSPLAAAPDVSSTMRSTPASRIARTTPAMSA